MQPVSTLRTRGFDQLRKAIPSVRYILQTTTPEDCHTYRDSGEGWTVTEVLAHLRDFDRVFLERAQLTMTQDFPPLPFPDPDQLAVESKYNEQDTQAAFEEWAQVREELTRYFESISEEDWERPGNHPKRGEFTLNDQLLLIPWHDMNHIEQITRILMEKR